MTGVYAIRRVADGKCYVGSAVSIARRWKGHRHALSNGTHHSTYLQRSWEKYGEAAHEFVVVEFCERDKTVLIAREQYWIDTLESAFNVSKVAGSRLGVPQPLSAVEHVAALNRGRKHTPDELAKMSAAALARPKESYCRRPRSAEHKAKISASLMGRPKQSSLLYGKHWIGRKHSVESRAKMSASRLGSKRSAETRAKMSRSLLGNTRGSGYRKTPEQIEQSASFHRGRKRSDETRQRMRDGIRLAAEQKRLGKMVAVSG